MLLRDQLTNGSRKACGTCGPRACLPDSLRACLLACLLACLSVLSVLCVLFVPTERFLTEFLWVVTEKSKGNPLEKVSQIYPCKILIRQWGSIADMNAFAKAVFCIHFQLILKAFLLMCIAFHKLRTWSHLHPK